jgi:hypothetical protein
MIIEIVVLLLTMAIVGVLIAAMCRRHATDEQQDDALPATTMPRETPPIVGDAVSPLVEPLRIRRVYTTQTAHYAQIDVGGSVVEFKSHTALSDAEWRAIAAAYVTATTPVEPVSTIEVEAEDASIVT